MNLNAPPSPTHGAAPAPFNGTVTLPPPHPEKLLRLPRVEESTSIRKSTIYALMRDGTFPTPVRLAGGRAVAWKESEVQAWIAARTKTGGANDGA